jgi:hypothetical protein
MEGGGAAGHPPPLAETFLVSPMRAECPAGAFANRGAAPAPNPSSHSKTKIKRESQVKFLLTIMSICL